MAAIGNKLYRSANIKKEEALDVDKQLTRIEEDMRKLKIDFDIYLNGATKRPPLDQRASSKRKAGPMSKSAPFYLDYRSR